MTGTRKVVFGTMAVAGLASALYLVPLGERKRTPREAVQEMAWPAGAHILGDPDTGIACLDIRKEDRHGAQTQLAQHDIEGRDFRTARDDEERKAWVVEHLLDHDMETPGLACTQPGGPGYYFQDALAQPKCVDCEGSCTGWSCPASTFSPGCAYGGTSCIILVICCDGPCVPHC